jgi:hypothetical protein
LKKKTLLYSVRRALSLHALLTVYTVLYTYPLFVVQGSVQYNVYVDLNLGQKAWEIVILHRKGTVARDGFLT